VDEIIKELDKTYVVMEVGDVKKIIENRNFEHFGAVRASARPQTHPNYMSKQ